MTTYYVEAEQPCQECQGTGVVQHPAWAAYWQEHPDGFPTAEDDARWFREQGYDYPPDEEVPCSECGGTGIVRERVTLSAALAALGFQSGRLATPERRVAMCKDKRGGDRRTDKQRTVAQERAAQMAARRAGGMTLAAIAREFGVTRQRVHAILSTQDPGELAAWQAEQARQADWD